MTLGWVILLWVFSWFGQGLVFRAPGGQADRFSLSNQWDSRWFELIAMRGYVRTTSPYPTTNFFPLYPLITRIFSMPLPQFMSVNNATIVSGVAVSIAALVGALLALFGLSSHLFPNSERPFRIVRSLLIFPTAFFFATVYSESLYLAFSVLLFSCARKKQWLRAGCFGGMAALTRSIGIILIVPLVVEVLLNSRREWKTLIKTVGIFFALYALFPLFLWARFGDPFLHLTSARAWGVVPPVSVEQLLKNFHTVANQMMIFFETGPVGIYVLAMQLASIVLGAIAAIWSLRQKLYSFASYAFIATFLPVLLGSIMSQMRYTVVIFPIFLMLGSYSTPRGSTKILSFLSATFLIVNITLYVNGVWVS